MNLPLHRFLLIVALAVLLYLLFLIQRTARQTRATPIRDPFALELLPPRYQFADELPPIPPPQEVRQAEREAVLNTLVSGPEMLVLGWQLPDPQEVLIRVDRYWMLQETEWSAIYPNLEVRWREPYLLAPGVRQLELYFLVQQDWWLVRATLEVSLRDCARWRRDLRQLAEKWAWDPETVVSYYALPCDYGQISPETWKQRIRHFVEYLKSLSPDQLARALWKTLTTGERDLMAGTLLRRWSAIWKKFEQNFPDAPWVSALLGKAFLENKEEWRQQWKTMSETS